jgi:hypothetical protein
VDNLYGPPVQGPSPGDHYFGLYPTSPPVPQPRENVIDSVVLVMALGMDVKTLFRRVTLSFFTLLGFCLVLLVIVLAK